MKGVPLTLAQRQRIVDLRRGGHTYKQVSEITRSPYNTVAGICRAEGLQKERDEAITLVNDPSDTYRLGPTELKQVDLCFMLALSGLPDGFAFTIGSHYIETQDGIYVRDDGCSCVPNRSGTLRWEKGAEGIGD
jgi:hypothetical protein